MPQIQADRIGLVKLGAIGDVVNTLPFAKTWGDASTNLHYPFK